ncbi:MAG: xanthine dehydrogenase accessory protein XdhC [Paracoccaceae bacterium]|nr:xanthine dehydrogenase accessory protein XdhC [Paracoccaceae bacterium]
MSFDREELAAAIARHGAVARVVVADAKGSAPREAGTAMLVWAEGQEGTIGGGALEWEAAARARDVLGSGETRVDRLALGPSLGQCCGGAVVLVTEVWDAPRLGGLTEPIVARPLPGGHPVRPLGVARAIARARDRGARVTTRIVDDWLIEPVAAPDRRLWVWGAGHVGRAVVSAMAPLPRLEITWVDTAPERFPAHVPDGVVEFVAASPGDAVPRSPVDADHLILTYSHALDLDLCHRLLSHGFRSAGLIGSGTKWARFRARLRALGHAETSIARIACPIGEPGLGKAPAAIAIGVAAAFLRDAGAATAVGEESA